MNSLSDDLLRFTHAIVHGDEFAHEMNLVCPNYPAAIAMDVYRNNYRGNLHDALTGAYPVIEQLVGRDFFRHMTRQFIEQHHSRNGNLHHYGTEMAGFIATFEPAQELTYLPDVVALEWACHCAYFADDAATLDIGKLAQLLPEQYPDLILITHPSCHILRSNYPIVAIWQAHQPGAPDDFHIDLAGGSCLALVIRKDDVVLVNKLSSADAEWLSSIQAGITLGVVTADTLDSHPDFDLQTCLSNLVSLGVFTGISLGGAT